MNNLLDQEVAKKNIVLYFQVHQPLRLAKFRFFDIGSERPYFDDALNNAIIDRVARECYLPTNAMLLRLISQNPKIRVAFSISGITLDKLIEVAPEVVDSFRDLAATGSVEFLGETHDHSLACMIPGDEFETQVRRHREKVFDYLGVYPVVFRNTELIYNDDIASRVRALGFKAIFCDGIEKILGYRSPHHLYKHDASGIKILLRNYRLSDDIAFRFANQQLDVDTYMQWLKAIPSDQSLVNIALDYETFGEHQKKNTGIFSFFENLLVRISDDKDLMLATPSQALRIEEPRESLSVPVHISWADRERDLSAWLGNPIQQDAFDTLCSLREKLRQIDDPKLIEVWRKLQTSDHFYYMSTKHGDDGQIHAYFSPYPSPYEAFINFMNVLSDFRLSLERKLAMPAAVVPEAMSIA